MTDDQVKESLKDTPWLQVKVPWWVATTLIIAVCLFTHALLTKTTLFS